MQQSKRVFRLYIWRNQGSVCIVDAVAIKGVEMGGSLVHGIELGDGIASGFSKYLGPVYPVYY